jgi:hypothetical protein
MEQVAEFIRKGAAFFAKNEITHRGIVALEFAAKELKLRISCNSTALEVTCSPRGIGAKKSRETEQLELLTLAPARPLAVLLWKVVL